MTQEEKSILLKDLGARLPYGVKCKIDNFKPVFDLRGIDNDDSALLRQRVFVWYKHSPSSIISYPLIDCKPYLRPMSSMTEEERIKFSKLLVKRYCEEDWEGHISTSYCIEIDNVYTDDENGIKYPSVFSMDAIDWLNAHHFDYRGLIEKGLALEAPEGMY